MDTLAHAPQKATIYQISLRTFTPEGTLKAAEKLLPFIAGLGPRYVQLCPVVLADDDMNPDFWSKRQKASGTGNPKNSYRIKDFFTIDEEYGTDQDLSDFIATAHRLGLRVMLDLVYYHCGPKAVFLGEHPDYVLRNPDGSTYIGEWNFPLFNFDNPRLREYLWSNMTYFVEKFDVDGYRCDVGDLIPLDFWAEGIRRVRALKPDFYMLNEGRNAEYLRVFDANYFYEGCFDAVPAARGSLTAEDFRAKWEACRSLIPEGSRMLHYIDNHDICSDSYEDRHERTIGTAGVDALLVLTFLLDGVPFVFNGYEVADELKHNMFANRFYGRDAAVNWANYLCPKGRERYELLRRLYALRASGAALQTTALTWADHSAPEEVIAFCRPHHEGSLFTAVNMTDRPVSLQADHLPQGLHLMRPELVKNASWAFRGEKLELQLLGYGYLAAAY